MKTTTLKHLLRWSWAWVPALILMVLLISGNVIQAQTTPPVSDRADASGFMTGTLDPAAVQAVLSFGEFPVVWLGEEFKGYKLSAVAIINEVTRGSGNIPDIRDHRVSMVYGSCEILPGHGACTPPLSIIIWGPDTIPGPRGVEPDAISVEATTRGLISAIVSESTVLWAGDGIAIQIHSNGDIRDEIVESLQLANGPVMGLPAIDTGESLAPLINVRGPGSAPAQAPSPDATATPGQNGSP